MTYQEQMEQASLKIMLDAVVRAEGNQIKAAEALGIHRNTVSRELRKHGWNLSRIRRYAEEHNPVIRAKQELRRRARLNPEVLKKPVVAVGLDVLLNGSSSAIRRWTA